MNSKNMIILRRMKEEDVPAVMDIENVVVEFPWSASIFSDCIKVGYSCWVYEEEQDIVGYGLVSGGANEAHILNVIIRPDKQHQGLGRRLMNHLVKQSRYMNADSVYLEVRVSNAIAQSLYFSLGFVQTGLREGYYPAKEGREDALILTLQLKEPPAQ